jgi:hypothetical protein
VHNTSRTVLFYHNENPGLAVSASPSPIMLTSTKQESLSPKKRFEKENTLRPWVVETFQTQSPSKLKVRPVMKSTTVDLCNKYSEYASDFNPTLASTIIIQSYETLIKVNPVAGKSQERRKRCQRTSRLQQLEKSIITHVQRQNKSPQKSLDR